MTHLRAILLLVLAISTNYLAQEFAKADAANPSGLWIFGGLGGGYARVTSTASNVSSATSTTTIKELSSKAGWDLFGKTSLSYYTSKWASDFGLGYSWQQYSYKNRDPSPGGSATVNSNLKMTLRNLFFELSPRYRMTDSLQLGPYFQYHYGSDVGHSELSTSNTKSLIYYGAHLNFDKALNVDWIMRLGVQAFMDYNEAKRQAIQINGVIEFGTTFGGNRNKAPREENEETAPPPEEEFKDDTLIPEETPPPLPVEEPITAPQAKETGFQQVLVTLPSDKFLFDTGMSHIRSKETRAYLSEYGEILSQNQSQWKKLEITGHTDKRGTKKVNKELSRARAKTIYDTLNKAGVPKSKMTYKGYAFDKPVDKRNNPAAWAKNRRVEMKFSGVKASQSMIDDINELNGRYGYKSGSGKY